MPIIADPARSSCWRACWAPPRALGCRAYSSTVAYPFDIGGRPHFAWPSFIPTAFENAVLIAVVAGFAAFMVINRMPRLYDPVDEARRMREASSDGWFLPVRSEDAGDAGPRARAVCGAATPIRIEEVPHEALGCPGRAVARCCWPAATT